MAEVVAKHQAAASSVDLRIESFGIGSWHEGEGMDPRARRALETAGYVDHGHLARGISAQRLADFDLLVVADRSHERDLKRFLDGQSDAAVVLLRSFDDAADDLELADPYYGDQQDFERCLEEIESAVDGLLAQLLG